MSLEPGTLLGNYEIETLLGKGGMGEVYRARDLRLERPVAIKVLPAELSDDADFRARLEAEAKTISKLQHPNVCTLYDVGREGTLDYLVMECLEGETLEDRLARAPLPLEQVVTVGTQIAEAVEAAHRRDLVHRDLKPGNVMLTEAGAKVLDFGLAKGLAASPLPSDTRSPTMIAPLTGEGMIAGTLLYMSPEQLEGKQADPRSDLWALGCVLYEMVTGKRPFDGESQASVISSIMSSGPPPLRQRQPLASARLERLVSRCLEKDPEERWQSARDVALELAGSLENESREVATSAPTSRRAATAAVAALAALIAGAAGYLLAPNVAPPSDAPLRRFTIPTLSPQLVTANNARGVAVSDDGNTLAYADNGRLWIRSLESGETRPIRSLLAPGAPFFSPDGRWVAYAEANSLKKLWLDGGEPLDVCRSVYGFGGGAWSHDGRILLSDGSDLWVGSAEEGDCRLLLEGPGAVKLTLPDPLPDGEHALVALLGRDSTELGVVSMTSGELTALGIPGSGPRFLPPRTLLFSRGEMVFAMEFDPEEWQPESDPVPVLGPVEVQMAAAAQYDVADDGTLIYYSGRQPRLELVWVDRGGRAERVTDQLLDYWSPRLSPQGRHIAVAVRHGGSTQVLLYDVERDTSDTLVEDGFWPAWSPDGRSLSYVRGGFTDPVDPTGDQTLIFQVPLDRSDQPAEVELSGRGRRYTLDWARNRPVFTFYEYDTDRPGADIWVIPEGGEPLPVLASPEHEYAPQLSPDARWLAYAVQEPDRSEVYLTTCRPCRPDLDLPQIRYRLSNNGGEAPTWRGDGRELFYVEDGRMMSVAVSESPEDEPGVPEMLFQADFVVDAFGNANYDVTADGQRFLMIRAPKGEEGLRSRIEVVLNWDEEVRRLVPGR